MKLRFHPEAGAELILDAPERWSLGPRGVRRIPLRRFPFTLVYRHTPGTQLVEVVAIAHQSRRPDYWRHRS